jgi:uncharacterized surface protein with fasciclin (FAS1) repeats
MNFKKRFINLRKQLKDKQIVIIFGILSLWILLQVVMVSCESDRQEFDWFNGENSTIGQYMEANQKDYSKFYRLLVKGKMLSPLLAYNPHGDGYTLFLPSDSAIDVFVRQNKNYGTFEKLLQDSAFIYGLTRYHTINRKVHTNEFPDGALNDKTLSGDRLILGFFSDGKNQLIKVNNNVSIVKSNLKLTNGYIHFISSVLNKSDTGGYDWLQQQTDFSILAQAMELAGIRGKLKWNKYTLLAEHDSVFHRIGIHKTQDLINRIATPGVPLTGSTNPFYLFAAYHILNGEFYLNDFYWGAYNYTTLASKLMPIDVGQDIRLNSGVEKFGITISATGDTTITDYILPVWDASNVMTKTGPVHSLSRVLHYETFPK